MSATYFIANSCVKSRRLKHTTVKALNYYTDYCLNKCSFNKILHTLTIQSAQTINQQLFPTNTAVTLLSINCVN